MLKWIAQNKYKLIAFTIGLYLLFDVLQHKGQTRLLFPKNFPVVKQQVQLPLSQSILINKDKNWKKGVNTKEHMNELSTGVAGFECDVYFDTATKSFDVHHDPDKSIGYNLDNLLQLYQQRKMQASIWLDIKNLNDSNAAFVLQSLVSMRSKYKLQNKILVESGRADLLTAFSNSNFFTAFYVPFFNPYTMNNDEIIVMSDSLSSVISKSKINALSGYYFQWSFLNHYFSKYPVLTWIDHSSYSLVNSLFRSKIASDRSVFIVLKP